MKGGGDMHERLIKQIIKSWIDNSNWSDWTKRDLKIIVDVSRTVDEVAYGFLMYQWCISLGSENCHLCNLK